VLWVDWYWFGTKFEATAGLQAIARTDRAEFIQCAATGMTKGFLNECKNDVALKSTGNQKRKVQYSRRARDSCWSAEAGTEALQLGALK
jgi:hypothetical protein